MIKDVVHIRDNVSVQLVGRGKVEPPTSDSPPGDAPKVTGYVRAWLKDEEGKEVSGTRREGGNVFTNYGREWLIHQMSWAAWGGTLETSTPLGPGAVLGRPYSRILYIGVGDNAGLEVPAVTQLGGSLPYVIPELYRKQIVLPPVLPVLGVVRYSVEFLKDEISIPFQKDVDELGLYLDRATPGEIAHPPVAYKVIESIPKTTAFSMIIEWEIRIA